ncbi:MAG: dihydrofolate reductase [Mesorhizobium sp.]
MLISGGKSFPVIGHAIVSADGMIADARGLMPGHLRNDADWTLFQAALDMSALVVLGAKGHRRHPNPGRRRLVFTSTVATFEQDGADQLSYLYNPAGLPLADAVARTKVAPGIVAVTGGRAVFDHFLGLYDEFLLAEVNGYVLPSGVQCFSAGHPRQILAEAGMTPAERRVIDAANDVTLTRWLAG